MNQYHIVSGTWQELKVQASAIRTTVFIVEQHIAEADEWDNQDSISLHFVLYKDQQAVATARLLTNNSIGRVAVLKEYRGLGLGKLLMQKIIQIAKQQNRAQITLSAQQHAIQFYEALGFKVQGELYLDCGIAHVQMVLDL